jgi:hypothetical protein
VSFERVTVKAFCITPGNDAKAPKLFETGIADRANDRIPLHSLQDPTTPVATIQLQRACRNCTFDYSLDHALRIKVTANIVKTSMEISIDPSPQLLIFQPSNLDEHYRI